MDLMSTRSPLSRRSILSLGAALVLAACGGDEPTASSALRGTFTLQSIDGQPLPVTRTNATTGVITTVQSESIVFRPDLTFTNELRLTQISPQGTASSHVIYIGTFSTSGNEVSMSASSGTVNGQQIPGVGGSPIVATLEGDRISVSFVDFLGGTTAELVAVYEKQ